MGLCKTFHGVSAGALWDYANLMGGCSQHWPKARKGRRRVDLGGHVGKWGGGGLTASRQRSTSLLVLTLYMSSV